MKTSQQPTRDHYFAAEDEMRVAHVALAEAADPAERATLLYKLFRAQQRQAKMHTAVFGPVPLDDEAGRDLAESEAHSATLYGLLADVEQAIAYPGVGQRGYTDTPLEPHAGATLNRMAATPDLDARMRLLNDLIGDLEEVIGGQAVETLWCLPAPGFSGPLTVEEKDAWYAENGYGVTGVATFSRAMDRYAPRLAFAAVVFFSLLGIALTGRALAMGSWPLDALGLALAVGVPVMYVRTRLARRRFLAMDEVVDFDNQAAE